MCLSSHRSRRYCSAIMWLKGIHCQGERLLFFFCGKCLLNGVFLQNSVHHAASGQCHRITYIGYPMKCASQSTPNLRGLPQVIWNGVEQVREGIQFSSPPCYPKDHTVSKLCTSHWYLISSLWLGFKRPDCIPSLMTDQLQGPGPVISLTTFSYCDQGPVRSHEII